MLKQPSSCIIMTKNPCEIGLWILVKHLSSQSSWKRKCVLHRCEIPTSVGIKINIESLLSFLFQPLLHVKLRGLFGSFVVAIT